MRRFFSLFNEQFHCIFSILKIFSSNATFSEICDKLPRRLDNSMKFREKENNPREKAHRNYTEIDNSDRNFNQKTHTYKQNTQNSLRSLSNNIIKEPFPKQIPKATPLDYKSRFFL